MPLWLIGVALVGGYLYFTGKLGGGSTNGWSPVANPIPIAPEMRDAYAQAFAQKPGTAIRFLIQSQNGEQALAIGAIRDVKIVDGKRLWRVELISATPAAKTSSPLPAPGAMFTIGDQHLSA